MSVEHHHLDGSALVFRVVSLGNGDRLAECMDAAGEVQYWLLRPLAGRQESLAEHGSVEGADHETLAPLLTIYRQRLAVVPLRCGRPRQDGRPCRTGVSGPGEICRHHTSHEPSEPTVFVDPIVTEENGGT